MKGLTRLLVAVVALVLAALVLWPRPIEAQLNRVSWNQIVGGVAQVTKAALATTSTDGFTVQNTTASTSGVPVQLSPRLKWCGTAYNSTSTLSETDCMFAEVIPATVAGTTTATWRLGYINPSGTITYPMTASSIGALTMLGNIAASNIQANGGFFTTGIDAGAFVFGAKARLNGNAADGFVSVTNQAATIGSQIKVDALPTVASGFGTSPTIAAGSTPFAGSVNVGTGGTATSGVINFNGTAFPSAPFCTATPTTSNVVQRVSTTTTQLTLTVTTAWTASDVVFFQCISSK